jgi:hypothetical protein
LTIAETTEGFSPRGVHHVYVRPDARERLLDAFELADRRLELDAHARVRTGRARGELRVTSA